MDKEAVHQKYGHQIRIRSCGLLVQNNALLLIKMQGLGELGELWLPPGGGLEFGESLTDCVIREFQEEVGIQIETTLAFAIHEHISPPLHAIEHFYIVKQNGSTPPEIQLKQENSKGDFITELKMFSFEDILATNPKKIHSLLRDRDQVENILRH